MGQEKSVLESYLLDGAGGAKPLSSDQLSAWQPEQGVLWVHLNYSAAEDVRWIDESSGLDPLVVEALLTEDTRPRIHEMDDGLLIALRGVNLNPGADPEDMVSIRIWIEKTRIITTRRRDLVSINDVKKQFDTAKGPSNAADFLIDLVDYLIWHMSDTIDQFEEGVSDREEQIMGTGAASLKYELAIIRRKIITLRRYLAPQRDALARLIVEKVSWLDEDHRLRLREVNDRLLRHIEDLDAIRDRAAVAQEELLSRLSEQLNSRMYVLSVVAAIFLPLGFLTGLLGINVGGIPGAEYPWAFWVFMGILIVIVVLQIFLFRWKNWL